MPYTSVPGRRVPIRMWTDPDTVEPAAMEQLHNIAALPWADGVAVMPDCHLGKGATVGSVIAMRQAVSPAAVGVDIGCGMAAVRTNLTDADLPDDLRSIRAAIENAVPVGRAGHTTPVRPERVPGVGGWQDFWSRFDTLDAGVQDLRARAVSQMGSLGGGNHFIEVCVEQPHPAREGEVTSPAGGTALGSGPQGEPGRVWLMLHSGSRGIGNKLAEKHMSRARALPHNADLPDPNLAVFLSGTPQMQAYRNDLFWAQEYAARNRATIVALIKQAVREALPGLDVRYDEPISCHHNYVAEETHDGADLLVTRKGAIRAGAGGLGIIPGSMGTGSFIVRGLGNAAAYDSAAHGAGRAMSRNKARQRFSAADLVAQTDGVECRKDDGVVDEIPAAYKNINTVMDQQADLVEILAQLKQVICVKG